MRKGSCCMYATGIISAHLLIVGIALFVGGVFQTMIHNKLKAEIKLTEGSKVFASWKNPPPPIFLEFFFFNVTNPEEFLKGEAKPRVTEMGPYTYRQYRPKRNVTFVDNGMKVAAYTQKSFVFVPEKSVGDPSVDQVTTVNIPAVVVMNKIKGAGFWASTAFSMFMNSIGSTMFMTHTVNELLWGFKDPLLTRLRTIKPEVEQFFGLMYNKNGSDDGEFVYHTGEHNYMDFGRIYTWQGKKVLTFWGTNQSNMINGSDGSGFHAFLSKEERLNVFAPDLCR
ncbi:lysosome membrane protein 2-like [Xyrauchen texanus]|uniref:lysosome membrane protein 2-like n=1 Tax=Xyrauchen texanus TaxID=154827 RepID=UPI0022427A7B|nr:lysosome membrane protein 2-like [Xyrauchen texanus]